MSRIVIALGGNALGNNPIEEKNKVLIPAKQIVQLISKGHHVLVGHGNGPQVGMIYNGFVDAKKINSSSPLMPFPESGAMSQGYIGYHLQTAIANCLLENKIDKNVVYMLTQTIVDTKDKAFLNPTKPIGSFYKTKKDAIAIYGNDSTIVEDSGRGFRKVVASPKPINFLSIQAIIDNFNNKNNVLLVGGGGGIPTIIDKNDKYVGVDGVIDKDFALSKIAQLVNADILVILTTVPNVFIGYNTSSEQKLTKVTTDVLDEYINKKQFAEGSMLPKIIAALEFVRSGKNKKAIIAGLENLNEAVDGKSGTIITN